MVSRLPRAAATLVLLFFFVASCASGGERDPGEDSGSSPDFWEPLVITADEAEYYGSLGELQQAADVAGIARVDDYVVGRTFVPEEAPDGAFAYATMTVQIQDTLVGAVPDRSLPVEFVLPVPPDEAEEIVAQQRQNMPQRDILIFLRHKGGAEEGLYRVVNSTGLWAEGPNGPWAPLTEIGDVAHEAGTTEAPYGDSLAPVDTLQELVGQLSG